VSSREIGTKPGKQSTDLKPHEAVRKPVSSTASQPDQTARHPRYAPPHMMDKLISYILYLPIRLGGDPAEAHDKNPDSHANNKPRDKCNHISSNFLIRDFKFRIIVDLF